MIATEGVRKSIESLFDRMENDERFDSESFMSESADNKTALEFVDRVVDALSPPKCVGLESGCRCWRCGQAWCEANYSKDAAEGNLLC